MRHYQPGSTWYCRLHSLHRPSYRRRNNENYIVWTKHEIEGSNSRLTGEPSIADLVYSLEASWRASPRKTDENKKKRNKKLNGSAFSIDRSMQAYNNLVFPLPLFTANTL